MKKFSLLILFALAICTISCQKEDVGTESEVLQSEKTVMELEVFKENFPGLAANLNYEYLQGTNFDNQKGENSTSKDSGGYTIPVMEDGKVFGRYIWTEEEEEGIYLDYSNYEHYITIYNVNNPNDYLEVKTFLNPETNTYEAVLENKGFWCGAACGVGTVAIAASDGPSPLMDVLAVSYAATCLASCAE